MPHGDVAVGKVAAICGFERLDAGGISYETSVPLVGHEFGFLLLRAVRVPLLPEALSAAVDVGPLLERDAAVGPRRPHALAEAVLVLTFGALTPLPCRPAAMFEPLRYSPSLSLLPWAVHTVHRPCCQPSRYSSSSFVAPDGCHVA